MARSVENKEHTPGKPALEGSAQGDGGAMELYGGCKEIAEAGALQHVGVGARRVLLPGAYAMSDFL